MPSSRASRRAVTNESRSETRIHSSTTFEVDRLRPRVLADALDEIRVQLGVVLRGVDRSFRIDADDAHAGLALVEPAADAGDRAAGADGDDDRVDCAAGLLPDLRRGDVVVRLRVRHVRVLVGLEAARDLLGEPRRHGVVALRRVVVDGGRRDHDLRAVRAQHRDLLLAHLVRHHEDAAVALPGCRDREADAGVAGGRLDDRSARLQLPVALGGLDHREADPVLHRAAGVEELELREDPRAARRRQAVEPDDRRAADEVEDRRVVAGHPGRSLDHSFDCLRLDRLRAHEHECGDDARCGDAGKHPEREREAARQRARLIRAGLQQVRRMGEGDRRGDRDTECAADLLRRVDQP